MTKKDTLILLYELLKEVDTLEELKKSIAIELKDYDYKFLKYEVWYEVWYD